MSVELTNPSPAAPIKRALALFILLWLIASASFALSGALRALPRYLVPLMIWTPVLLGALSAHKSARLRAAILALDDRAFLAIHLVRMGFGAAFLVLGASAKLPGSFAYPAGVGDVMAGVGALALLLSPRLRQRAGVLLAWNIFAFVDMLSVFVNAQRVLFSPQGPQFIERFSQWPFGMLPTSVVSLVLLSHLAMFWRLRSKRIS